MNQKNLEYLKEGLKYLGFGEGLNNKLTENVAKQAPEFQLSTVNEYAGEKIAYSLDFRKSDKSDMYFFNKYTAVLKGNDQTFYISKNTGITAKEAYNLLNGRAVNKDLTNAEGQKYNTWLQLDFNDTDKNGNYKFKQYHQGYGYDLEKQLAMHPIKELNEPATKERLMQSLERGNLHQVTFVKMDKEEKMFIEANPQYKTLNIYDERLRKVYQEIPKKENGIDNGKEVFTSEKKLDKQNDLKKVPGDESDGKEKKNSSKMKVGM